MTGYPPVNGFSPLGPIMPSHQPLVFNPYAEMQSQTTAINIVNSHYESGKRLAKNYQKFIDDSNLNALLSQMWNLQILPFRKSLEINKLAPIDYLPVKAQEFVDSAAMNLGVSAEIVATCLFGATFIAARGNFKIRVDDNWSEVLTAILILGAQSGDRKSAVLDLMRPVFESVESELRMQFDRSAHHSNRPILEQILKKMERNLANKARKMMEMQNCSFDMVESKLKAEFAAAEQMRRSLQKPKSAPRLLLDTPTLEALAIELERQGEAIGIFEAEGGFWKHRVKPETDDILLKAYTGEAFSSHTKTLGSVDLQSPVLAVCSLVQHDVLQALYANAELTGHGATPRVLPVFLPSRRPEQRGLWTGIPSEAMGWYTQLIRRMLSIRRPGPVMHENERTFHVLRMSSEARGRIGRYGRDIDSQIRDGRFEKYPAFGAKLAGHGIRLAGAIHLMTHFEPQSTEIDDKTMDAGIAWAEFFRVHAEAAFTPEARDGIAYAQRIYDWMKCHRPQIFCERDAHRGIGSGRHSIAQIRAGIDELDRCNLLRRHFTGKKALFVVHPSAYFQVF